MVRVTRTISDNSRTRLALSLIDTDPIRGLTRKDNRNGDLGFTISSDDLTGPDFRAQIELDSIRYDAGIRIAQLVMKATDSCVKRVEIPPYLQSPSPRFPAAKYD